MAISFSGLGSGLDTASWVSQLTALKQAKVTTLQNQVAKVMTSQDALSNIKTYFNNFRSSLERLTDAKFKIDTLNLFVQNIATTSDPTVLTASATSLAEEAVYNIKVDRLATNTSATSKHSYTTTIVDTTTATTDSLLKHLGISSGNILVTVNGVQSTVSISENDTLGELVTKFKNLGASASYNETTGIFTMDTSTSAISDIGSTGIVSALHLSNVNKGYETGNLSKNNVVVTDKPADVDTKLSDLGVSAGTISLRNNEGSYTITLTASNKVSNLISKLAAKGITATIDDGYFRIENAEITDEGTTNIISAFGMSNPETSNITQSSNSLRYESVTTTTTSASGTTMLKDLGVTTNNKQITLQNNDGSYTITLTTNDTFADLVTKLSAKGIEASIDDGIFTIVGANITNEGGSQIISKLGLSTEVANRTQKSKALQYTTDVVTTTFASGTTKLSAYGVSAGTISIRASETTYSTAITANTTFDQFMSFLSSKGIVSSLTEDGVFTIENARIENEGTTNISTKLGLSSEISSQLQRSGNLTYQTVVTSQVAATGSTRLGDIDGVSISGTKNFIYRPLNDLSHYYTYNVSSTTTLNTIKADIEAHGGTCTIGANGGLYVTGVQFTGGTFDLVSALKLNSITDGSGQITYTGSALTTPQLTTLNPAVTTDIELSYYGVTSGAVYVYSHGVRNEINISVDETFASLTNKLNPFGVQLGLVSVGAAQQLVAIGDGDSYLETKAGGSNVVTTFFSSGKDTSYTYSNQLYKTSTTTETVHASNEELLSNFGITSGQFYVVQNGVRHIANISEGDTFADLRNVLQGFGLQASIVSESGDRKLVINGSGDSYIMASSSATKSNIVDSYFAAGAGGSSQVNYDYTSTYLYTTATTTDNVEATNATPLSQYGVTSGQYYIYNNGVKYVANISADETMGEFRDTLQSFGLQTGLVSSADGIHLIVNGSGDSYVAASSATGASNVVSQILQNRSNTYNYHATLSTPETITTPVTATLNTLVSDYDANASTKSEGRLNIKLNGQNYAIDVAADETFGTLVEKFERIGIGATLSEAGKLTLHTGDINFTIENTSTSKLVSNLGLTYNGNLGGFMASSSAVQSTITTVQDVTVSAANYADDSTVLSLLNITSGTLSVYRNGQKATIDVVEGETFGQLRSKINSAFGDVTISLTDGYLKFYSTTGGVSVDVGSSIDTSNFTTLCGLVDGDGTVMSARELYKVNSSSNVTTAGLFRKGDVRAGTFTIGNAEITINASTKMSDIINQINSSEESNATAYWDSVDGKLVIKSRTSGSTYINIEAGTSNFTDIMGFTNSTWNPDNSVNITRLDGSAQKTGDTAVFSINGTQFTSTSNIITSDVSRINGLTINLKNVSEGESVTLSVSGDSESVSNALSDVVDSYNELITNVDAQLAKTGNLSDQTSLKYLRNRIRSIMTSSSGIAGLAFTNLSSIGISTSAASSGNISTTGLDQLYFDKDKFMQAYNAERGDLEKLLVGADESGILSRLETVVESALTSVSGYFYTTENSFAKQITKLNERISKQNKAVATYQSRLENKFSNMDLLISQIQNQYSSFLGT